jgi:uncharacterized protein YhfF
MWGDFLDAHLEYAFAEAPKVIRLHHNEKEANRYIQLVVKGIKKAVSHSLLVLQYRKEPLPKIGDFVVIADGEGKAQCLARTTSVNLRPFFSINEAYAQLDGIGDRSLVDWKTDHWERFNLELEPYGRVPRESMIVVCQEFEKVF